MAACYKIPLECNKVLGVRRTREQRVVLLRACVQTDRVHVANSLVKTPNVLFDVVNELLNFLRAVTVQPTRPSHHCANRAQDSEVSMAAGCTSGQGGSCDSERSTQIASRNGESRTMLGTRSYTHTSEVFPASLPSAQSRGISACGASRKER
jgi:hypothetical protein